MNPSRTDNALRQRIAAVRSFASTTDIGGTGTGRAPAISTLALALLAFAGMVFRFTGVSWDQGAHLHPDERFLTTVIPSLGWPHSWAQYFDTANAPLNPFLADTSFFVYGQLPLLIAKLAAAPFHLGDYDHILIIGRLLSAGFDCATVMLTFVIGRRLNGTRTGLLAAALLSLMPLHIQQSHFFVVDTFATFFIVATFYAAICWYDAGCALAQGLWCGLWLGIATACKFSSLLIVLAPLLLFFAAASARIDDTPSKPSIWVTRGGALLAVLCAALLAFRIAQPIAFRGRPELVTLGGLLDLRPPPPQINHHGELGSYWDSLNRQRQISSGNIDVPWNYTWFDRRAYFYPLRNLGLWGMGLPTLLAAACGLWWIVLRRKTLNLHRAWLTAAVYSTVVFLYYGQLYSVFTRYFLQITPFLALFAALFLNHLWRARSNPWLRRLRIGLQGAVLLWAFAWSAACTSIYRRPSTRIAATEWLNGHLKPLTPVARESGWDDALPVDLPGVGGGVRLQVADLALFDLDTAQKRERMLAALNSSRWIFISSNRLWASIPRMSMRWPLTTRYYRALFDGSLGFAPVREFASYPQLNVFGRIFSFPDDSFEEGLTVYDHPRVVLFAKTPRWSLANAEKLLDARLLDKVNAEPLPQLRHDFPTIDEKSLPLLPSPATGSN